MVFTPGYFEDGAGHQFVPREVARLMAAAAAAPVYGPFDTFIGTGIVGGSMPSFAAMGRQAGEIANALLDGVAPAALRLPAIMSPTVNVDWRQVRRWGIDENAILADIRRDDLRASEVIRRLRALLAEQTVEWQPFDLNSAVREVESLLLAEARRRRVTLDVRPAATTVLLVGDRIQIQQVLINLILNALDAVADLPEARRTIIVPVERDTEPRDPRGARSRAWHRPRTPAEAVRFVLQHQAPGHGAGAVDRAYPRRSPRWPPHPEKSNYLIVPYDG